MNEEVEETPAPETVSRLVGQFEVMGSSPSTPRSARVDDKQIDEPDTSATISQPPESTPTTSTTKPSSPKPPPKHQNSQGPKDLMISYSHNDTPFMEKLRGKLEEAGISVWVDVAGLQAGVDFLNKIGQAIIDAKLFVSILSSSSINSKYCKDELALAYISSSAIFPITLEPPKDLYPLMDTGMKLQLASYKWVHFFDESKIEESFTELVEMLKVELKERREEEEKEEEKKDVSEKRKRFTRSASRVNIYRKSKSHSIVDETEIMADKFWKDRFSGDKVDWNKFSDAVVKTFQSNMEYLFSGTEDQKWLINVLYREMDVDSDNILYFEKFEAFCCVDGENHPLWKRIEDQARESYAMKEVFDMDSSVRVEAIENLAKFRSIAVIEALRDLLSDPDANVRSVAAISLARTEANDPRTINRLLRTLVDRDRLVREAGCLALGHLHSKQAVTKLLHMWRNDVISHVREAAAVALQQIGGVEVEQAMHVTKVLADEIRKLTEDT